MTVCYSNWEILLKDKMFPDLKEKELVAVLSPAIYKEGNEMKKHIYIS